MKDQHQLSPRPHAAPATLSAGNCADPDPGVTARIGVVWFG